MTLVVDLEAKMTVIPVEKAIVQLNELLEQVKKGEEVVITRADGTSFKLVAIERPRKPTFGSAKGFITMSDDFDEPLKEFVDYMP